MVNTCLNDNLCLSNNGESHCFESCTIATINSDECTDNKECIEFGVAPNNGFYCEPSVSQTQSPGEECDDFIAACVDGTTCLNAGGQGYCFKDCDTAAADTCATDVDASSVCKTITNIGDFCSAPKIIEKYGECNLGNDCTNGLLCLTPLDSDSSHCFDTCDITANPSTCDAGSICTEVTTDAFCKPECLVDTDCTDNKICSTETFTCILP